MYKYKQSKKNPNVSFLLQQQIIFLQSTGNTACCDLHCIIASQAQQPPEESGCEG